MKKMILLFVCLVGVFSIHAENQETPEECLVREVKEETGLTLTSYRFRGLVTFISNECEPELMCVFTADGFTGELIECDEGELAWVDKEEVPELPTSGRPESICTGIPTEKSVGNCCCARLARS